MFDEHPSAGSGANWNPLKVLGVAIVAFVTTLGMLINGCGGGHYDGGHGSSHKGGHYVNRSTGNHYTHHH